WLRPPARSRPSNHQKTPKTSTPRPPILAAPSQPLRMLKSESSQLYDSSQQTARHSDSVRVEACLESGMHLRTGQMEVCYLHAGYAESLVRDGESQRGL